MLKSRSFVIIILLLTLLSKGISVCAQQPDSAVLLSDTIDKNKLKIVIVTESALYVATMAGLYGLWYKNYPQSGFHFSNDNGEWLQMDKVGHITTSYYVGLIGYSALRWAGVSEKKATWYGGLTGLVYLSSVEVLDGFSEEWGASPGDLAANTLGAALFISQQLAWHEQRLVMKWSFHSTPYAQYNPDQLGSTLPQQLLKDYNGQTYWLSANISSFLSKESRFPKWLNFAGGYGADGMTGPYTNPEEINGIPVPYSERYRQFYISPDIDLSRIPVKSRTLKLILNTIGFIKIPMPALEFNKNGIKFHPLYF